MTRPTWLLAVSALLVGCAPAATQLIVVVDSDLDVPSEVDEIAIEVEAPSGVHSQSERVTRADLPATLTVIPAGEQLGPIEVRATALLEGTVVVSREARATLVRGETRMLVLHLTRACVGVACDPGTTCDGTGECHDVDVIELPPWPGAPPRLGDDGGVPDGGVDRDGGPPCSATSCDDGEPCTDDVCESGACVHRPNDARCEDEDFCDGADTCAGGTCSVHAGSPCGSPTTCDPALDLCVGCDVDADCPGPMNGPWSECTSTDPCAVEGSHARVVSTFHCSTEGVCEPSEEPEIQPCARVTESVECAPTTCGDYGACESAGCATTGSATRTCTDHRCRAGACAAEQRSESMGCTHITDGDACGATSCGAWEACTGFPTCGDTGRHDRACTTPICAGGDCTGSMPSSETESCTRPSEDGVPCGAATCDAWGPCSFADACTATGTQARSCTEPVCGGGSCGSRAYTETQACSRGSQDGVSCGADVCGAPTGCTGFSTTCDETGTNTRTCNEQRCGGGACQLVNPYSMPGTCTRNTDGNTCGASRICDTGVCVCALC